MGVKQLPEWQAERRSLHEEARIHLQQTSCTIWNEETQTYDYPNPCTTDVRGIGKVTRSCGIQLYFQLLRNMGFVFLLMLIVSAPTLTLSCMGKMLDAPSALSKSVAMTSVANMGQCPDAGCKSRDEERERCLFEGRCSGGWDELRDLRVKDVTPWLGLLDAVAVLIFMGSAFWFLQRTIPREAHAYDVSVLTPADYTCEVTGLPRRLEEEEHKDYADLLTSHLLQVLSDAKKDAIPLQENAIEQISLVRDYHGAVSTYGAQGHALVSLANAEKLLELAQKKKEAAKEGTPKEQAKLEKLVATRTKAVEKLQKKVDAFAEKLKCGLVPDEDRDVVKAYVTMKKMQYKEKLEFEYRYNQYMVFRCFDKKPLRFRGAKLKVAKAPEPTDLFWENLDFPSCKRVCRKAVVMLITFVVLVLCITVLVSIKSTTGVVVGNRYPTWALEGQGCFKLCSWSLHSTAVCGRASKLNGGAKRFFDATGTLATDGVYLQNDTSSCTPLWESPACNSTNSSNASRHWIAIEFPAQRDVQCTSFIQNATHAVAEATLYGCGSPNNSSSAPWRPLENCVRMKTLRPKTAGAGQGAFSENLHVAKDTSCSMKKDQFMTYEAAALADNLGDTSSVNCFCMQQLTQDVGLMQPPYETKEQKLCKQWSHEQAKVYGLMGFGIIAVVVVNLVLKLLFTFLTSFKRLETLTENTSSQLNLLFLTQFINTGILIFLVNLKLSVPGVSSVISVLQLGTGAYHEPNSAWFIAVGASLGITILTQVFSTTFMPVINSKVVAPLTIWWSKKSDQRVTLDSLKQIYELPEWNLGQRAAESLNIIACIIMYSGGMPSLYFAGVLYCVLAYHLDKHSLLSGSRKPPAYDSQIISQTVRWVPLFAFLHVLFACFVLSNPDVFPSDFSDLLPLAEGLSGVSFDEYTAIMTAWPTYTTAQQDTNYRSYMWARLLDFSRESVWPLMLLLLLGCAYYILYSVLVCLIKPLLGPFLFMLEQACAACPCCRRREEEQEDLFADAKGEMEMNGMPTGYSMEHSEKYAMTAKAIKYELDVTADEEPEGKPSAGVHVEDVLDLHIEASEDEAKGVEVI